MDKDGRKQQFRQMVEILDEPVAAEIRMTVLCSR
jgi:hypothetical protein